MHPQQCPAQCASIARLFVPDPVCDVGVQGTTIPSDWLLEQLYTSHLSNGTEMPPAMASRLSSRECNSAATPVHDGTMNGTALLLDSCHWLPALEGVPGVDGLSIPTRALANALREHLQSHLAHPKVGGLQAPLTRQKVVVGLVMRKCMHQLSSPTMVLAGTCTMLN